MRSAVIGKIFGKAARYTQSVLPQINAVVSYVERQNHSIRKGHGQFCPHTCCHLMEFELGVNQI